MKKSNLLLSLAFLFLALCKGFAEPEKNQGLENLITEAKEKKLANHPYWLKLLHYRKGALTSFKSGVDDPKFFLSKNGRKNPEAELIATLEAFFEPASTDPKAIHPQCQYPARASWLKENLNFPSTWVEKACPRLEKWKERLSPESVSVLFAASYLDNPGSMYGHTFLRLNKKGNEEGRELLDFAISYGANTTAKSGPVFAIRGLFGGYNGVFSVVPYYVKVQQYSNMEMRDLWEYKLNLSKEGINRLLEHYWEIRNLGMSYYFINKNCAYELFPLLDVADPEFNLGRNFQFKTIPVDTLRFISEKPNFVQKVKLLPSHFKKMKRARSQLTSFETEIAKNFESHSKEENNKALGQIKPDRHFYILDAAYHYFRYKRGFGFNQPEANRAKEDEILQLLRLSKTPDKKSPPVLEKDIPPHLGHPTGRAGLAFGIDKTSSFEEFEVRPAINDLEDDPKGYIFGSQLEMFAFKFRYNNKRGKLTVEDLNFVDVRSYSQSDPWVYPSAWRFHIGVNPAKDLEKDPENSLQFSINGGLGMGMTPFFNKKGLAYALVELDSAAGRVFDKTYRLGAGGGGGLLLNIHDFWRIHFSGAVLRYPTGNIGNVVKLRLVQTIPCGKNYQLRNVLERQNGHQETLLYLNRYF